MLLFTKIRGSLCNMTSYNQSSWIVLLTSSRLLVSVRISTALCGALVLKCGREERFCHDRRHGMGHQSFPCHSLHSRGTKCSLVVWATSLVPCLTMSISFPLLRPCGFFQSMCSKCVLVTWLLWHCNLLSLVNYQFQYNFSFLLGQCSTWKMRA